MTSPEKFEIRSPNLSHGVPAMRPYIVDGLLRRGEVCNFIGAPKTGKTWMLYTLIAAIASGSRWLGRDVTQGRVLLIDNELHAETLLNRLGAVVDAAGVERSMFDERVSVAVLRGQWRTLEDVEATVREAGRGAFDLIALDAFYRFIPKGTEENSNSDMTAIYNHLDRIADFAGAALVNVHHSSKGDQSTKATTDVGSGAGSIARATDTHMAFLRHMEDDCVVLRAECRSSRRPLAVALRLSPPMVTVDESLDLDDLWSPKKAAQAKARNTMPLGEFVETFVDGTCGKTATVDRAMLHGMTQSAARKMISDALKANLVEIVVHRAQGRGGRVEYLRRVV
jgi:hypothetical protein